MNINKTPVRTSKSFGINDIEIEDIDLKQKVEKFKKVTISGDTRGFKVHDRLENTPLTYGISKDFENQVYDFANQNIKIEANGAEKKNLYIEYKLDEKNPNLVDNIEIDVNKKASATIIIKYMSNDVTKNELSKQYHNGIIKVVADDMSKVNIIIINMLNKEAMNFLSIENSINDEAEVKYCIVDFGGTTSISNVFSNLLGRSSKSNLNAIYLGTENQNIDMNYIAEVRGIKSEINIDVQGALAGNATKNFKGTIDFKNGCKKAKGDENEFCMLLSDTAKAKALPMLLCTEEDVEGSHSTAAGKVEENMLFYIMSRGFSKKEAMKLIVKAKFNKILNLIEDEELKSSILNEIDERLD